MARVCAIDPNWGSHYAAVVVLLLFSGPRGRGLRSSSQVEFDWSSLRSSRKEESADAISDSNQRLSEPSSDRTG